MAVILKPNLFVEDIKLEINENDKFAANRILNSWGPTMPVIKINDYVLGEGEIIEFNLKISYNSIPIFYLLVDDDRYLIRKTLKTQNIDKLIIFIGYKDWYLKFNGIIKSIPNNMEDNELTIIGEFFNEKLYETNQKSYNKNTITDILKDICKITNMGLFTFNNNFLSNKLENCINSGKKNIQFFNEIIEKYTNNLWCLDTFGYFHVSNIETLRKQPVDKFKIFEGIVNEQEKDIIITTNNYDSTGYNENDEDKKNSKFKAKNYSIITNIGKTHINNNKNYLVNSNNTQKNIQSNINIGIGEKSENTFSGFLNNYFPFYSDIINKQIGDKIIIVELTNLIYEISPFSIVNLEIFLPKEPEKIDNKIDLENSGKKIVLNYEYEFYAKNKNNLNPTIKQILTLI